MAKSSPKLLWCVIRFGNDLNWWVKEISDDVHWDADGLSILDPKQIAYILDLLDPLRDYGLSPNIVENAFISFQIQKANPDKTVRLVRVNESFFDHDILDDAVEEVQKGRKTEKKIVQHVVRPLFGLPDIVDEEKGPYAEFIDHITRLRVKFLNDNIEFEQKFTIDELEEQVRETQNLAFIEGRALHTFQEITDILEFVPAGYEISAEDDAHAKDTFDDEDEDARAAAHITDDDEEAKIKEDDTMRWDGEEDGFGEEGDSDFEGGAPTRRRSRRKR